MPWTPTEERGNRTWRLLWGQFFVYRDLMSWLNEPFQAPPLLNGGGAVQLALALQRMVDAGYSRSNVTQVADIDFRFH